MSGALANAAANSNAALRAYTRPGSRVVTSCTSHVLLSGSLKEKNDP
jgi:hypothetical protein